MTDGPSHTRTRRGPRGSAAVGTAGPAGPWHRMEGEAGDPGAGFLPSWAAVLVTTEHPLTWPPLQLPAAGESIS